MRGIYYHSGGNIQTIVLKIVVTNSILFEIILLDIYLLTKLFLLFLNMPPFQSFQSF